MPEQAESKVTTGRILLVGGDPTMLKSFRDLLAGDGYEIAVSVSERAAVSLLYGSTFDLVIAGAQGGCEDLNFLRRVKRNHPETAVILVASDGSVASAVEAIRQGANDYLTKPLTYDQIRLAVGKALTRQESRSPMAVKASGNTGLCQILGQDLRMLKILEMAESVASSQATVLITGESGTGKSLVARAIHACSQRRNQAFVEVACGAIPDTLLESELFGHVRGAFTDAVSDKPGKFAVADGGTIFLDEISTASPQLQVKLLRVLQERQLEPVGSNETQQVDVRVILATNRDLNVEVEAGRFRQDLYYRVNVVTLELPPLRERTGDVVILAEHFLGKFASANGKEILGFSADALSAMRSYDWPGNIRELENCVERAVVLSRGAHVSVEDLPEAVLSSMARPQSSSDPTVVKPLREALKEPEKQIILAALQANGGCRKTAAKQLGIDRTTLYKKMKRYGLNGE